MVSEKSLLMALYLVYAGLSGDLLDWINCYSVSMVKTIVSGLKFYEGLKLGFFRKESFLKLFYHYLDTTRFKNMQRPKGK